MESWSRIGTHLKLRDSIAEAYNLVIPTGFEPVFQSRTTFRHLFQILTYDETLK